MGFLFPKAPAPPPPPPIPPTMNSGDVAAAGAAERAAAAAAGGAGFDNTVTNPAGSSNPATAKKELFGQ